MDAWYWWRQWDLESVLETSRLIWNGGGPRWTVWLGFYRFFTVGWTDWNRFGECLEQVQLRSTGFWCLSGWLRCFFCLFFFLTIWNRVEVPSYLPCRTGWTVFLLDGGAFFFCGTSAREQVNVIHQSRSNGTDCSYCVLPRFVVLFLCFFWFCFVRIKTPLSRDPGVDPHNLIRKGFVVSQFRRFFIAQFVSIPVCAFGFVCYISSAFVLSRFSLSYLCRIKKKNIYIYIYIVLRIKSRTGFVERNSCWPNYLILFSFFLVIFVDWGLAGWPS